MRTPPCRTTSAHDWAYGDQSQWCLRCWLVVPYDEKHQRARPLAVKANSAKQKPGKPGRPYSRGWLLAVAQPECCYCGDVFTELNPPTIDHIVPVSLGGTRDDFVLACLLCNNARAHAPYEDYLDAVLMAIEEALAEDRPYRRPKTITHADGSITITTASRRERNQAIV